MKIFSLFLTLLLVSCDDSTFNTRSSDRDGGAVDRKYDINSDKLPKAFENFIKKYGYDKNNRFEAKVIFLFWAWA